MWWALGGITLVATLLRFYRLDHGGLWYDELIMARITAGSWPAMWAEVLQGRPPIYPVAGKLWADLFGQSDAALRSLSAMLGVLSVPVLFLVARRLFDWRVGLIAAVLLAVSPYQVYYGQEHRYYALFLLLCLTSIALLLRALGMGDGPCDQREPAGRAVWVGYVLTSALAFYTHTFTLFLLSSIGIAVLAMYNRRTVSPGGMRRFLISQVAIMGMILPWGLLKMGLVQRAALGTPNETGALVAPWISSPPWWAPVRSAGNFLFLGVKYVSLPWAIAGLTVLIVGVTLGVMRGGGLKPWAVSLGGAIAQGWTARRGAWWIAAAWAAGPLLMVMILSYTVRPIYNDRYLMASTAGLYVLAAAAIVTLARVVPIWATMGLILLGMAGSLGTFYAQPDKGAWVEAAAWLDENLAEGEALAFTSERGIGRETANVQANWFWYAQRGAGQDHPEIQVREDFNDMVRDLKAASEASGEGGVSEPHAGVWLVMWRDPNQSLGLADSFAHGPVDGLALAEVKKFFDLTLLRFERTDAPAQAVDPSPTRLEFGAETDVTEKNPVND